MHTIAVLALHGVLPFDLSTPCEIFSRLRTASGEEAYRVRVCGEAEQVKAGLFDLRVSWGLDGLDDADSIIVPGLALPTAPVAAPVLSGLRAAARRGARVASICTGAFVLAEAGLLDHCRATTHWRAAEELARRYPRIDVDPAVLFVDEGQVLTSAGAAAGIDLCLHLVRRDHGTALAAEAARLAVAPLVREGGQSQFMQPAPPPARSRFAPLLGWLEERLEQPHTLATMARRAGMSERTFSRRFQQQVGRSPLQWLLDARIRQAQQLLERTDLSVEQIAFRVGFDSPVSLRAQFRKRVGVSPGRYRRTFGQELPVPATG